jgi:hypothetical protein
MSDTQPGDIFVADYRYIATSDTELSLNHGDKIIISSREGDWIYGYREDNHNIAGWIGASYGHIRKGSPYAGEDDRSKSTKRTEVFQSILESENTFVRTLQELQDKIINVINLKDDAFKRAFVAEPSVAVSFSILTDMLRACTNFASLLTQCKNDQAIYTTYNEFSPSIQLFAQYATENIKLLNEFKKNSKGLKKLIPSDFTVEQYLVEPLEHYKTYKSFLQEYIWLCPSNTPKNHLIELENSLDRIIAQCDYVDLKLKEETEALRLLALQSSCKEIVFSFYLNFIFCFFIILLIVK